MLFEFLALGQQERDLADLADPRSHPERLARIMDLYKWLNFDGDC